MAHLSMFFSPFSMCQGCAPLLSQLPTDQLGPAEQHREAWRGLVSFGGLVGTMVFKRELPPWKTNMAMENPDILDITEISRKENPRFLP